MAAINNINGKWIARCGDDNIVAEDTTEQGLREQLEDLGIEVDE
jgi:hypothetical protein